MAENLRTKYYLGWIEHELSGEKVPCLCRGIIGVDIDTNYAKRLQLKETTKEEWQRMTNA